MKAIVCKKYGLPDILELRDVFIPVPKDNEALVKVYASSLNAADLEILKGVFVNRIAALIIIFDK
jgi:NADPH:quinone reductase-like Zn-dependent oxidoreductase